MATPLATIVTIELHDDGLIEDEFFLDRMSLLSSLFSLAVTKIAHICWKSLRRRGVREGSFLTMTWLAIKVLKFTNLPYVNHQGYDSFSTNKTLAYDIEG